MPPALVVQRNVQVPRPAGLVLEQPPDVAALDGAFPGFPADDLQRAREAERPGLEQVVEVAADLSLVVILIATGVVAVTQPGATAARPFTVSNFRSAAGSRPNLPHAPASKTYPRTVRASEGRGWSSPTASLSVRPRGSSDNAGQ